MIEPMLKVEKLRAWYGESTVLHGINFEVRQAEIVTLLGRNGAGKSTALKSIAGAITSREGRIHMQGTDITVLPTHQIARHGIAFVPEERGIFASLNVEENLTLPPVWGDKGFTTEELYEIFPNLYERRHSPGTKLSGGEQQMLAIARVLRAGPQLLILDEPTEGLAPVIVQRIGQVIEMLRGRGVTILLVEQNFRFARRLADRHYIMQEGHIIDCLDAREIRSRTESVKRVLGL